MSEDWNYWLEKSRELARERLKDAGVIIGEKGAPPSRPFDTSILHEQEAKRRTLHAPTGFMLTRRQELFMDIAIIKHPKKWNSAQRKLFRGDRPGYEREVWKMFRKETHSP